MRTSLLIDPPTYERFVDLARHNERSTSAELRVAIRRHLAESQAAAAADGLAGTPAGPASGGSTAVDSETLVKRGRSSARVPGRAHELDPGHADDTD